MKVNPKSNKVIQNKLKRNETKQHSRTVCSSLLSLDLWFVLLSHCCFVCICHIVAIAVVCVLPLFDVIAAACWPSFSCLFRCLAGNHGHEMVV